MEGELDKEEDEKTKKPTMQRLEVTEIDGRGRSRFKDKGHDGPRSKSAHCVRSPRVSTTSQPETVFESASRTPENQRAPSKEDKNKNNALIASTADSNKEDDEYLQYLNSVDKYRQSNPKPMPIRPVTSRTDAIANPPRKTSDGPIRQQSVGTTPSKRLQITPVRENNGLAARTSQSVPKETRTEMRVKEESQAEILGLVRTNRETGKVEQTNDMDYEDYMNIINKVRKTKESTRVRTEQIRLSSMYAQERKRQQEIQLEEERLKREYQEIEEESKNPLPIITTVASLMTSNSNENLEKGQIDNKEKEQYKISPKISPSPIQSSKSEPSVPQWENQARQKQIIEQSRLDQIKAEQSRNEQTKKENEEVHMKKIETERMAQAKEMQKRFEEEERKKKEAMKQEELKALNEKQRQEQQAKQEKQKRIEEQQQQEKIQEQARPVNGI
jgi:hypothetical protein